MNGIEHQHLLHVGVFQKERRRKDLFRLTGFTSRSFTVTVMNVFCIDERFLYELVKKLCNTVRNLPAIAREPRLDASEDISF